MEQVIRLLCLGDSNTYGYDPRSFLGGRYPEEVRWTGILNRLSRWKVVNWGENGREIPHFDGDVEDTVDLLSCAKPFDAVLVMLGGNDLLRHPTFTAEDVTGRMERFLLQLKGHPRVACGRTRVVLLAPVPMVPGQWVGEERLLVQSARLPGCYGALARRLEVDFIDTSLWGVEKTFDGVHFSETGHRAFAIGLEKQLEKWFFPQT